jgi:hypothetical protein
MRCGYDERMEDVDVLAALRESMARLMEEAHHLCAVSDKLVDEGRRLRRDLGRMVERAKLAQAMRRAA